MARMVACRYCRVEFETIRLGASRTMVMCFTCEQTGFADEVAHGAPLWPAEIGRSHARGRKTSRVSGMLPVTSLARKGPRKKITVTGK